MCGYRTTDGAALCQQCTAWQPITAAAEAAIKYAKQGTAA